MPELRQGRGVRGAGRPADRNTLGVGGQAYEFLLSKLDERSGDGAVDPQRVHTRIPFLNPLVRVVLEDGHGGRELTLACRNLSRGGVGLLHSSFMYPGSRVSVHLPRSDGAAPGVRGEVVRVEHRGGVVHEIGVKFDEEITLSDYFVGDVTGVMPSFERVPPHRLSGSAVFVTASEADRLAINEFLLESSMRFRFVGSCDEALGAAGDDPEIMLVDVNLQDRPGPEVVKRLRTRGYTRPVVLFGDPPDAVTRSMMRPCGADALAGSPLTRDGLLRVLGEFMLCGWDPRQLDMTRSRVDRATLVSLCSELGKLGAALEAQAERRDRVGLFGTCRRIAGMSLMVGMNGVATMAERLSERAAESDDLSTFEELLRDVRLGCAAAGKAAA